MRTTERVILSLVSIHSGHDYVTVLVGVVVVPMKRVGEPAEVAPSYLFLASDDASHVTGQVLHPNGGEIING